MSQNKLDEDFSIISEQNKKIENVNCKTQFEKSEIILSLPEL